MSVIKRTKDYSIFQKHENNRPIEEDNVKRLVRSITALNLLEHRPLLVDDEMRIIDGQHRLEAAKHLKLEVFYQVKEDATDDEILVLATAHKNWTLENFFNYWATKGNEHYIKGQWFMNENHLTFHQFMQICQLNRSTNDRVKKGNFIFPDEDEEKMKGIVTAIEEISETVKQFVIHEKRVANSPRFKRALIGILSLEDVDVELLKSKIKLLADRIKLCANVPAYFNMLLDIYNWKNRKPISSEKQDYETKDAACG